MTKDEFIRNDREKQFVTRAQKLSEGISENAAYCDKEGEFPFASFEMLKQANYLQATIPEEYGGEHASLYEMVLMQEYLAKGDGSTALGVGWHLGMMLDLRENRHWPESLYEKMCKETVENGEMINSFASEPATGSPTRGGVPETYAEKTDDGWLITGRKTFSTLSPILNYFVVSAKIKDEDQIGRFLVHKSERVTIKETWDTLGMRATGSHDVILDKVFVPIDDLIELEKIGEGSHVKQDSGWMLHIPACYIGIAHAARDFAVQFALNYRPNSLPGPIAELSHIKEKLGKIEVELKTARTLLYSVADRWDQNKESRLQLKPDLGLVKYVATNSAISIVDQAMRIVGGSSLAKKFPLERMYRDVRAGLHNPPMDDNVLKSLAEQAYKTFEK